MLRRKEKKIPWGQGGDGSVGTYVFMDGASLQRSGPKILERVAYQRPGLKLLLEKGLTHQGGWT